MQQSIFFPFCPTMFSTLSRIEVINSAIMYLSSAKPVFYSSPKFCRVAKLSSSELFRSAHVYVPVWDGCVVHDSKRTVNTSAIAVARRWKDKSHKMDTQHKEREDIKGIIQSETSATFEFYPTLSSKDFFKAPRKMLLKTFLEKEKMLVTSIFSFFHYVFYPRKDKLNVLSNV